MMNALIEPFFYCLLASMIWAPIIFLSASLATRDNSTPSGANAISGKIWPFALVLAALPVMLAPIAAALGLSLRAPAPLPPMLEPTSTEMVLDAVPLTADYLAPNSVSFADIMRTAAVLYFYGFLMLLFLAAIRHIWFAYRLNYASALDEPKLEAALENWRHRIGVIQRPRYVFSHIVSSVCVYGFFRPIVVMPFNLLDRVSIEDAALMGAHEMAHIKRRDVALFALCSVAKAVFWFNPFMHQICARANLAAEQGADALVLASGVNRRQYAQCFVQGLRLAANSKSGFAGELIPSFTPFDKRSRRRRLDAILSGNATAQALNFPAKAGLVISAVLATAFACAQAAFAVAPPSMQDALPVTPVKGDVTLGFGEKSKLLGAHEGIDIRASRGEPVRAAGAGKIIAATNYYHGSSAWGNVVVIDHGHGLVTRYAHLENYKVRKGDQVDAGDVIGAVGATGVASGPHLHFEVIASGESVDPAPIASPAPAAAPAPKASTTVRRNVSVAPAPAMFALPEPAPGPDPVNSRETERLEKKAHKLESKRVRLEEHMRKMFEEFDAFRELDGKKLRFNDIELDGFDGARELVAKLQDQEFAISNFSDFKVALPKLTHFAEGIRLSEDELEALHESREAAMEVAADAMEKARDDIEASREARREALQLSKESARERKQAQRERKEAKLERESGEREWRREKERMMSEEEILAMREQAIRDAKNDLEQELAEIELRREELKRSSRQSD